METRRSFRCWFDGFQVHDILNNVVNALDRYEELKFIWSETSFLEKWWSRANVTNRDRLRRLIDEKRLEITGGAWVMNDEAVPYLWSVIDNMIVGQQFLQKQLNVTPRTSWSVDPFGHSSMMPYLLSLSGINNMVIGRISAVLKETMRRMHRLHFKWIQPWDIVT
ncbi:unnamed protein product [Anisakis simplex]|uniref:Glyco_hydro_38N domain-containing protein n=1 Tax=Anisakis simplex TaxID=6269 RepID=A0A0M3J9E4_ANISI|nr:unnamed protein product [Anisakis simplex]